MKTLLAMAVARLSLCMPALASAQSGNMMNGGNWGGGWMATYGGMGGYGGAWVPALVVVALIVLAVLVITQNRK